MSCLSGAKRLAAILLVSLAGALPAHAAYPDTLWKVDSAGWGLAGAVAPDGSVFDASFDANCIALTKRAAGSGFDLWTVFLCGDTRLPQVTVNVDAAGFAIVLWRFQTGATMFAGKYDPDGNVVWERAVTEEPDLLPSKAAIDPAGNVLVVGSSVTGPLNFVVKLAVATGMRVWRQDFAFMPVTIAADSSGNAIVGERNDNNRQAAIAQRAGATGAILWRRQFESIGYQHFANAVAVDSNDDVVITGGLQSRPGDTAFTTLKLSGINGNIFWSHEMFDGISTDSFGTGVAIDSNDDVVVVGRQTIAKYLADGTLVWQVDGNYALDPLVVVDSNGDVIVTGSVAAGTQTHVRTYKFSGVDGAEIWIIGYADGPKIDAAHFGLAATATGPVIFMTSRVDRRDQLREIKYSSNPIAARNYQALWWAAPAGSESGWGLNVTHQGDILFLTWFTYDLNGDPMWLVVSDAREAFGQTYTGKLYRTTGPAFNSVPFNPAAVQMTEVGVVYIDFTDASKGTFRYDFIPGGPIGAQYSKTKAITRLVYDARVSVCSAGPAAGTRTYQDLWWAAPAGSESGWGVNVTHQGDILFVTWFTYDATGRGMWIVGSRLEKNAAGAYTGTLYRTRGPSFTASPWPPAITMTPVGTGTFTFSDPEHGTFAYTVDGISQSKAIVRMLYALPATTCVFPP